jgi:hypothetical protein
MILFNQELIMAAALSWRTSDLPNLDQPGPAEAQRFFPPAPPSDPTLVPPVLLLRDEKCTGWTTTLEERLRRVQNIIAELNQAALGSPADLETFVERKFLKLQQLHICSFGVNCSQRKCGWIHILNKKVSAAYKKVIQQRLRKKMRHFQRPQANGSGKA